MSAAAPRRGGSSGHRAARSAARLAAVQALYEMEITGAGPDEVLPPFLDGRVGGFTLVEDPVTEAERVAPLQRPDGGLLAELVRGAARDAADLDQIIARALTGDATWSRLEATLRAILRAGVFELRSQGSIPPRVTISEYVDVAHAFYAGPEPSLVNAVLDRVARVLRDSEMG